MSQYKKIIENRDLELLEIHLKNSTPHYNQRGQRDSLIQGILSARWENSYSLLVQHLKFFELVHYFKTSIIDVKMKMQIENILFDANHSFHKEVIALHGIHSMADLQSSYLETFLKSINDEVSFQTNYPNLKDKAFEKLLQDTSFQVQYLVERAYSIPSQSHLNDEIIQLIDKNYKNPVSFETIVKLCLKTIINPYKIIEHLEENKNTYNSSLKTALLNNKNIFNTPFYIFGAALSFIGVKPPSATFETLILDKIFTIKFQKKDFYRELDKLYMNRLNNFHYAGDYFLLRDILQRNETKEQFTFIQALTILEEIIPNIEEKIPDSAKIISHDKIMLLKEKFLKSQIIPTSNKQKTRF